MRTEVRRREAGWRVLNAWHDTQAGPPPLPPSPPHHPPTTTLKCHHVARTGTDLTSRDVVVWTGSGIARDFTRHARRGPQECAGVARGQL